jgi:protocatechuate 3,4-dioxygenase beta subunit
VDTSSNYDVTASAESFIKGKTAVIDLTPGRTRTDVRIELDRGVRVTGTVQDEAGSPVADALVSLRPAAGRRMGGMMIIDGDGPEAVEGTTGEDGRFTFTGLPAGSVEIRISRKGFAKYRKDGIDLAGGEGGTDLGKFTLSPGGTVQGLVLDAGGMPVEGAEVRVAEGGGGMRMVMMGGSPPSDSGPDGITAPDGWFTLEDQPLTGKINLSVTRSGFLQGSALVHEVPNLEPVTITLEHSLTFSGVVLDGDGEPVPRADLNLTRSMTSGGGGMMMKMIMVEGTVADELGRFEYDGLEPGKISISGSAPGFQETKIDGIEMVKGEDRTGFELPLTPGAVLIGRVLAPDGKPAINAAVGIVQDGSEPRFGQGPGLTRSDGGGNYRLENLPPGPVSIEATHDSYVRTVRDIEATEGINSLDLQFEGGQQVAGLVTGPDGAPVPGATVRLDSAGRGWGGPQTDAGADGRFVLEGVSDGQYSLVAGAEGYAPPAEQVPVQVAGEPVTGLTVQLQATAVITGAVTGLEPSDYPEVEVNAFDRNNQFGDSRVDSRGRYRIEGLGAGSYSIIGAVGRSGNQARAEAVLEPGQQEAVADLTFGEGVTLSGKAFLGEQPFASATVGATGTDVSHSGWGETESDGSFRLSGLKPGNYKVEIRQWKTGISYEENVEISSSREIELRIPTATVSGMVVDSADRRPLAGVRVSLAPPDGSVETFFGDHSAVTDLNGRFAVGNVADGSWTVWASKKGYATASREVALQIGSDRDDVRMELDPTEGLSLEVRFPTGAIPDSVRAAVLDPAGRTVNSGGYATGENGSVRLSSVPRGSWDVVLYAPGAGVLSFRADAPGGPVPVILPRATVMTVRVPELAGSDSSATLTLTDSSGLPFRSLEWYGDPVAQWNLRDGAWSSAVLPPGTWNVTVRAADGRTWQGSGSTGDGGPAEMILE